MSDKPADPALDQRLEDLEVRMAYLEHALGELDAVVRQTADELARIKPVVHALRKRAEDQAEFIPKRSAEEEKPPHY